MEERDAYMVDLVIPQVLMRWIGVEPAKVGLTCQRMAASGKRDRLLWVVKRLSVMAVIGQQLPLDDSKKRPSKQLLYPETCRTANANNSAKAVLTGSRLQPFNTSHCTLKEASISKCALAK
jgi:hypothetical protein